jgi:hypothetical protein
VGLGTGFCTAYLWNNTRLSSWSETHWISIQYAILALTAVASRLITRGSSAFLKRLVLSLLEVSIEAVLLGFLFAVLLFPHLKRLLPGVLLISPWIVVVILFLHGYYLSRVFMALLWRSIGPWAYPAIVAALLASHAHLAWLKAYSDLSSVARAVEMPFVLGGVCVVFACALPGNRLLQKWTQRMTPVPGTA